MKITPISGIKGSEFKERIITGILLVFIIVILLMVGSYGMLLFTLMICWLAMKEYCHLVELLGYKPQKAISKIAALLPVLISWSVINGLDTEALFLVLLPLPMLLLIIELFRKTKTPFQNAALMLTGILWISLSMSAFMCIGFLPLRMNMYNPILNIGYLMIVWLGDSGAYIFGKLTGKHKLWERISPNKTIEGSLGGLLMIFFTAYLNYRLLGNLTFKQWLILALIIYITGTFGDLVKSMLKRSAGVKDSSTLLPGHGGILDRFDSLIGSAPFAFIYLITYAKA